jgi:hypothetical protein
LVSFVTFSLSILCRCFWVIRLIILFGGLGAFFSWNTMVLIFLFYFFFWVRFIHYFTGTVWSDTFMMLCTGLIMEYIVVVSSLH